MNNHLDKEDQSKAKYSYARYIQSDTQKKGNKVVILSLLIILLTLKIIDISSMDVNTWRIKLKYEWIYSILILMNIYYFLQFRLLYKLDNANFRMSDLINQIKHKENGENHPNSPFSTDENSDNEIKAHYKEIEKQRREVIHQAQIGNRYVKANHLLNERIPKIIFLTSMVIGIIGIISHKIPNASYYFSHFIQNLV